MNSQNQTVSCKWYFSKGWSRQFWSWARMCVILIQNLYVCHFDPEPVCVSFWSRTRMCVILIQNLYVCHFDPEPVCVSFWSRTRRRVILIQNPHVCHSDPEPVGVSFWSSTCRRVWLQASASSTQCLLLMCPSIYFTSSWRFCVFPQLPLSLSQCPLEQFLYFCSRTKAGIFLFVQILVLMDV